MEVQQYLGPPLLTAAEQAQAEQLPLEHRFAMILQGLMTDEEDAASSVRAFQEASLDEVQGLR